MKTKNLLFPVTTLGFAAVLMLTGEDALGFSKIGGSLGVGQRDVRVFNNFSDGASNNNTRMFPDFPGYLGAEQALWKGSAEWNSAPRGGDPTQTEVGNGNANFDITWQGNAAGVGGTNDNIVSAINNCGGGVIAFTETPISNGWRIRFCDNSWSFSDGPNNIGGGTFDLQGVQTHEYGHALGLGHSGVGGSTMFPSGSPGSVFERSIAADDIAGLQCIYGVSSASRPTITDVSVDTGANTVTITGTNFDTTATNDVWFTNRTASATASDPRIRVLGVASTGGTSITVSIPANAGPGEILVKNDGGQFTDLSNSFPTDLGEPIFGEATFFNGGGSNPTCFTSTSPPQLGLNWTSQVDASGHPGGAGFSGFLLYSGSSMGIVIGAGELLVDLTSTNIATVAIVSGGGIDNLSIAIPDDINLYQRMATAQGFTFDLATGLRLCNAENIVLGGRP